MIGEYLFDKLNLIYTIAIISCSILSYFIINKNANRIFDDFYVWKEIIPLHNKTQVLFVIAELFVLINNIMVHYKVVIPIGEIKLEPIKSILQLFVIYYIITSITNWLIIYYSFRKSIVLYGKYYSVRKMSTLAHMNKKATKLDKCMRV